MKTTETKVGQKIKMSLPYDWVMSNKMITPKKLWFKGIIKECHEKAIVVNLWNKQHNIHIKRLMCFAKEGEYSNILSIK